MGQSRDPPGQGRRAARPARRWCASGRRRRARGSRPRWSQSCPGRRTRARAARRARREPRRSACRGPRPWRWAEARLMGRGWRCCPGGAADLVCCRSDPPPRRARPSRPAAMASSDAAGTLAARRLPAGLAVRRWWLCTRRSGRRRRGACAAPMGQRLQPAQRPRYATHGAANHRRPAGAQTRERGAPSLGRVAARPPGPDQAQLEAQLGRGARPEDTVGCWPGLRLDQAAAAFTALTSQRAR